MAKAIIGGLSFVMLLLGLCGGAVYYMMSANSDETKVSRFIQYEQCRANQDHYNCDLYLIGKGTFRPGDMTDDEHKGLDRAIKRGISSNEYMANLKAKDEAEIKDEKEAYYKWKEEQ